MSLRLPVFLLLAAGPCFGSSEYRKSVLSDRPAVYWKLDETVGKPIELVSSSSHGEFVSTVAYFNPGQSPAFIGSAFAKQGHANFSKVTLPAQANEWTLEGWFRYEGFEAEPCEVDVCTGQPVLCQKGGEIVSLGGGALAVKLDGAKEKLVLNFFGSEKIAAPLFKAQVWKHLAFERTRISEELRVYVDGALVYRQKVPGLVFEPKSAAVLIGDLDGAVQGLAAHDISFIDRAIGEKAVLRHWRLSPEAWKK